MDTISIASTFYGAGLLAAPPNGRTESAGLPMDGMDGTLTAVLDSFAVALCIVDANRTVSRMNAAARESIGASEALVVRERRLCGTDSAATLRLSGAVGKVCGMQLEQDAFQLACARRPGVRLQVQVRALGVPQSVPGAPAVQRLALVIFGQASSERHDAAMLRRLFGLSNAEACLLKELLQGKRLDECAAARQITMGTARTQLKAIFLKTGASSQGQLIAIAKTLPAAAPSPVPNVPRAVFREPRATSRESPPATLHGAAALGARVQNRGAEKT